MHGRQLKQLAVWSSVGRAAYMPPHPCPVAAVRYGAAPRCRPSLGPSTLPRPGAGTYLDVEDVLSAEVGKLADGRDAYLYEINAFYAQNGNHSLAAFTTKVGPGRRRGQVHLRACVGTPSAVCTREAATGWRMQELVGD